MGGVGGRGCLGGYEYEYDLILEGSIKWLVYPSCGVGELEPGQLRVEVLFIIFPPVGSHERQLETVAARRPRSKGPSSGYVKHTQSLSPCRGDYDQQSMSHTCTGQHNGNSAGQWRRRERAVIRGPTNEMDYINPFCCSSYRSLNIEVTDSTSH